MRACAPTHLGISYGDDKKNSTSTRHLPSFENTTQMPMSNAATASADFSFFEKSPVIREIIFDLQAIPTIGKKGVHAICNVIKSKIYETNNGDFFEWVANEETTIELLIVILSEKPNSPIPFLKKLILAARNGEFLLKANQQKLLISVHRRINPDYAKTVTAIKTSENLSAIQKLQQFVSPNNKVKDFKPLNLQVGTAVEVSRDIPFWKANKGDKCSVQQFDWQCESYENSLHIKFPGNFTPVDYEQICKAIELGLFRIVE